MDTRLFQVFFRVDASTSIGAGHISRCCNLARLLAAEDFEIHFVCADVEGEMTDWIKAKDFNSEVHLINVIDYKKLLSDVDAILNYDQEDDALKTAHLIRYKASSENILIIHDHYSLDLKWEASVLRELNPYNVRIAAFDDTGKRDLISNFIINQNPGSETLTQLYKTKAKKAKQFLGMSYALIEEAYLQKKTRLPLDHVPTGLIYFGGCDKFNITQRAINALAEINRPLRLNIVNGLQANNSLDTINIHHEVNQFNNLPSLWPILSACSFAIGAGGVSAIERVAAGIPSLIIPIAENQIRGSLYLATQECAIHLPTASTANDIKQKVARLIDSGHTMRINCLRMDIGDRQNEMVHALINIY